MFQAASLRLASFYLLIIMVVSVLFSMSIYQLSVQELDRGLRSQESTAWITEDSGSAFGDELITQLQAEQAYQYEQAKGRVMKRLVLVNVLILAVGGFLSYYLARRTLAPIEAAHEAQRRFTADASHELRTPLTAMQSETEVTLMNPKLSLAAAKKQLKSNLEELAKLSSLSEGLLRLASQEAQAAQQNNIAVDQLTQAAIDRVLPLAEKKHILIHPPKTSKAQFLGDRDNLIEALVILLENAVKYSPEKSEIMVGVRSNSKVLTLTVQDQGIGIKPTDLPHIFDRFYRADAARSAQQTKGYGLGLAIAKNIITQHQGDITVKSSVGKGTTFTIKLPRH